MVDERAQTNGELDTTNEEPSEENESPAISDEDAEESFATLVMVESLVDNYPQAAQVFALQGVGEAGDLVAESIRQSLMQRTKMFMLFAETSSDPHFVKDRALRYVYVNAAMERMLNRPKEEILDRTDKDLYTRREASDLQKACARALQGSTLRLRQRRRPARDRRIFLDTLMPWKDHHGNITGVCGSHVEISEVSGAYDFSGVSDSEYPSQVMQETLEQALLVAKTRSTVLLLGESGSGKDFLARYIHDHSDRSSGPFRALNCAALPSELAESELFGHEKGAFTGARSMKRGHVELANGGTLLLNEIGELPLPLQAKLLTFLDTRSFTRVGGEREVGVDARIIAATNRDLDRDVRDGRFRHDLLFRLNVFTIVVPPLRQRKEDLPLLVNKLIPYLAAQIDRKPPPRIRMSAMDEIVAYHWPGNVRELRNCLEKALIQTPDGDISTVDLDWEYEDVVRLNLDDMGLEDLDDVEEEPMLSGEVENEPAAAGKLSDSADGREFRDAAGSAAGHRPEKPSEDKLRLLFDEYIVEKKWPRARLAKHMGVDSSTLKKWCKAAGLPSGKPGRPRKSSDS